MADRTIRDLCDHRVYKYTDDECLLEGIKVQNEKYKKCLAFIRYVSEGNIHAHHDCSHDEEARELLKELGEAGE